MVLRMRVECAGEASPWFRLILENVLLAEQSDRQSADAQTKENCLNGIRGGLNTGTLSGKQRLLFVLCDQF